MLKWYNALFCSSIFFSIFIGGMSVYGEKTPEEILHEAEQFSGHVSYSADSCEEDGRISQKKYVKVNPDGSRWTRLQGIDIDDMYTIMNDSGTYSVFGNTAVKAPPRKLPPIKRSPDGKPRKTTLTIAEGEWDGKPCYIITKPWSCPTIKLFIVLEKRIILSIQERCLKSTAANYFLPQTILM